MKSDQEKWADIFIWVLVLVGFIAFWAGPFSFKEAAILPLMFAGFKIVVFVVGNLKLGEIISIVFLIFMVIFATTIY